MLFSQHLGSFDIVPSHGTSTLQSKALYSSVAVPYVPVTPFHETFAGPSVRLLLLRIRKIFAG